ncbi:metallophosphoesterase [Fodinicola acaciae]|uniref:metallophosphoesterase n=1 Tax=Fodinicola acaciae TaxID=2681555 RepID=UPI0013D5D7AC|nr:metallophosphoesterase [Fodinicola acaciae]
MTLRKLAFAAVVGLALVTLPAASPSAAATPTCGTTAAPAGFSVTLCITAPANNAAVTGKVAVTATVQISGTAPSVNGITYTMDGKYLLFDAQSPYSFTLHTYLYGFGGHTLRGAVAFSGGYTANPVALRLSVGLQLPPPGPAPFRPTSGTTPPVGKPLVIASTGDGASGLTAEKQVATLIGGWNPNLFLYLGDVYGHGATEEYPNWYGENGSFYDRFRSISNPAIGNHEYETDPTAKPYFTYWGGIPHYYSYSIGNWHFVSLDNTGEFNQGATTSAQYQWLSNDLSKNTKPCTLVYFHRPFYSGDTDEEATDYRAYWQLLATYHVPIVLNGHSHNYQRWQPMDGDGNVTPTGVTELVAGTGGQWISPLVTHDPRLAAYLDTTANAWGAMKLELNPAGATYRFTDVSGVTGDYGARACGTDTAAPTAPTGVRATAPSGREVDLSWTAATDNAGVASYEVLRDGVAVGTARGDQTSYVDTTVPASTTMAYTVVAIDGSGNRSPASVAASVTTPAPAPTYVQSAVNATGGRATSLTVGLTQPVRAGDVLIGWFGQYDSTGPVDVSDSVNGAWTRIAGQTFSNGSGDVALYYVKAAKAGPAGLTVNVTADSATYLEGTASEYWGTAVAGALTTYALGKGNSTAADSGPTATAPAGSLVYGAMITGGTPGTVTAGGTLTVRAARAGNSVLTADTIATTTGPQRAAFTLGTATDWYAASAVLLPASNADSTAPSAPTGVTATATSASSVNVTWSAAADDTAVTGYSVYRDGVLLGDTGASQLSYVDNTVAAGASYSYTVVAFDAANNRSVASAPAGVTVPASSASFVQAAMFSTGSRVTSATTRLAAPVRAGDLLVGWFAQYDSSGPVQVTDDVNGAWTRVPGTTFSSGSGDISLYYKENSAAAASGVTVTVSADSATYLQGVVNDYGGVATSASLLASASGGGRGTAVDSGAAAAPAGALVFAAVTTGSSPGTITPGASNGVGLTMRTPSGASASADVINAAAGDQNGLFTLGTSTDWYAVCAVFRSAG